MIAIAKYRLMKAFNLWISVWFKWLVNLLTHWIKWVNQVQHERCSDFFLKWFTVPGKTFLLRFLLWFPSSNPAVHSSGESFGETSPSLYKMKMPYDVIYSSYMSVSSAVLFKLIQKQQISKEIRRTEHEYMNIHPQ
jgi:hypothetical protein